MFEGLNPQNSHKLFLVFYFIFSFLDKMSKNNPYDSSNFCPNPSALNGVSVSLSKCSAANARKSDTINKKAKRNWTDKLKRIVFFAIGILLVLLLLAIVVAAIAMLFDDDRALGRALHRWKTSQNGGANSGGRAMSTNGDGDRN